MKREQDKQAEEVILEAMKTDFTNFLFAVRDELMDLDQRQDLGAVCKEINRRIEERMTEKMRSTLDGNLVRKEEPISRVSYWIKRYEGALEMFKKGTEMDVQIPEGLESIIAHIHLLLLDYLFLVERVICKMKFEYEVV